MNPCILHCAYYEDSKTIRDCQGLHEERKDKDTECRSYSEVVFVAKVVGRSLHISPDPWMCIPNWDLISAMSIR